MHSNDVVTFIGFDMCITFACMRATCVCPQAMIQPQLASVVSHLQAEVLSVTDIVSSDQGHLPPLPLRPPVSTRLLWLHALRARVEEPMDTVKRVAPELLEGDEGWKLRQSHGDLVKLLDS